MACGCSDPATGCACGGMAPAGAPGLVLAAGRGGVIVPFPRQVLLGDPSGVTTYYSDTYEVVAWKTLAYWIQVFASQPGTSGPPVTVYIETGDEVGGPWMDIVPGGIGVSAPQVAVGAVDSMSRFLRVAVAVIANESTSLAVHGTLRP